VKSISWDKMNAELGGEATNEQIMNLFCNEYADIWFFTWIVYKESDTKDVIPFTPNNCEYVQFDTSKDSHVVSFYKFGEPPASHYDEMKEWDRLHNYNRYNEPNVIFEKVEDDSVKQENM
jgi:hypothetical protein